MHGAKTDAHCGHARQHAARHGHQAQQQHARGPVEHEQQPGHERGGNHGETQRVGFDARAAVHRKYAGPAHQQLLAGTRCRSAAAGECRANQIQRALLRVDVVAGGAGLRDEQGAAAVGREPHAFAHLGPRDAFELRDEAQ